MTHRSQLIILLAFVLICCWTTLVLADVELRELRAAVREQRAERRQAVDPQQDRAPAPQNPQNQQNPVHAPHHNQARAHAIPAPIPARAAVPANVVVPAAPPINVNRAARNYRRANNVAAVARGVRRGGAAALDYEEAATLDASGDELKRLREEKRKVRVVKRLDREFRRRQAPNETATPEQLRKEKFRLAREKERLFREEKRDLQEGVQPATEEKIQQLIAQVKQEKQAPSNDQVYQLKHKKNPDNGNVNIVIRVKA